MVSQTQSNNNASETVKFLCSYGGNILPRSSDGKLRYVGGLTRVLSVDRSISFTELMVKLVEFCGFSVNLRCQLPNGDLDFLISIKSDEDLTNIITEYAEAALISKSAPSKIRAILSPPKSLKKISPPPSKTSSINLSSSKSSSSNSPVKARLCRRSFSPEPSMEYSVRGCYSCYLQQYARVFFNAPCYNCLR
ncbi:hypothetical protein F3Y22_tig00117034pilonHSYRG01521 [Hibiscus syriacus]|uniref:PB1 domain-containing protein n=1 Tax=Hibiscus syriacus TaxID=106335 RepID=A0A6A2WB94_HIBSY|nr:uncharacterized protein LOC120196411 [Hibiscus syriacus]KAE8655242.1 hypothetical protein F3Y22_tig00117034pilonHSYRG01521 [Hibiscus syriacus]